MSNHKLAIVVPYRDRREHLDIFLPHIQSFLKDKSIPVASKALSYVAPPIAAYDLLWNKTHETPEEIRKKGLGQDLTEMALDAATLGAPAARIAGKAALGATLDRVRITTTNGTDTFDAGSINILYE